MRTIDSYSATICEFYLSALINGDLSGMNDCEAMQVAEFERDMIEAAKRDGASHWHWSYSDHHYFGHDEITGLAGMVTDVKLIAFFGDK